MATHQKGLLDLVKAGAIVAIHIGFGNERTVKSGQLRAFEFDTNTLTLNSDQGVFIIPLNSISAIKVIETQEPLHLV